VPVFIFLNDEQNKRKKYHIDIGRGRALNEDTRIHILLTYKHGGSELRGAEWPRKVKPHLLQVDGAQICLEKGSYLFYITMVHLDDILLTK